MGHKQPEARLAASMLSGESWSIDDALNFAGLESPHNGASAAAASAIGGLCGWIDGSRCRSLLNRALENISEKVQKKGELAPGWSEPLFLIDTALRLREAAQDARQNSQRQEPTQSHSRYEYVFCLSESTDCARLDDLRERQGLRWSEERMSECALAIVEAMNRVFSRLPENSTAISSCGPELAARLEIAHEVRPQLLDFLIQWRHRICFPTPGANLGCSAFEEQDPSEELFQIPRVDWDWVASVPSGKNRDDFPWGLWIAWSAPSLLTDWGGALNARWEQDAMIATELAGMGYERGEWDSDQRKASLRAAALLESAAIESAAKQTQPNTNTRLRKKSL